MRRTGGRTGYPLRQIRRVICFVFLASILTGDARGHDPGLSAAGVQVTGGRIAATLTLARTDAEFLTVIDRDRNGSVSSAEFEEARPALQNVAIHAFEVRVDGARIAPVKVVLDQDSGETVRFGITFQESRGSVLSLRSALVSQLPAGHRQYLSLRGIRGEILAEQVLSAQGDALEMNLQLVPTGWPRTVSGFVVLGVEHILTGYDHLAFLLVLLLAGGGLVSSMKIITSFTAAHSITLAVATMNLFHLPSSLVEPAIALSIVYVGVENIFSAQPGRRWLLAFGFGLIHGFGFASVLREMGIGSGAEGVLMPLLSFNAGVEIGQIAIAALTLPLIWSLRRRPIFATRLAPACSLLVALAGGYWLLQRTL